MSPSSIWKWRECQIRANRGDLPANNTVALNLRSPINSEILLRGIGSDSSTLNEVMVLEVYSLVKKYITHCNRIIDLGANIGLTSLYLANLYKCSKIVAVEPDPYNFHLLSKNLNSLQLSGRAQVLQAAVWIRDADLVFNQLEYEYAYDSGSVNESDCRYTDVKTCRGLTMERIIDISGFDSIDLVKVDIEGAEVQLFQGETGWLDKVKAIAIEFHGNSRRISCFDDVIRRYGFNVLDGNEHTTLAIRG